MSEELLRDFGIYSRAKEEPLRWRWEFRMRCLCVALRARGTAARSRQMCGGGRMDGSKYGHRRGVIWEGGGSRVGGTGAMRGRGGKGNTWQDKMVTLKWNCEVKSEQGKL